MHEQKSGAASLLGRCVSHHSSQGRGGRKNLAEVEEKHHVCIQLAECANAMSCHDMFALFKSGAWRSKLCCDVRRFVSVCFAFMSGLIFCRFH